MFKRNITFENYNGDTVTETLYFNLSKAELLEMQTEYKGGLENVMKNIIETNDAKQLIAEFKKLILLSYGQKTADGKKFIKNAELRDDFTQTAAYSELFMELATDDKAASEFINGIIPKGLKQQMDDLEVKDDNTAEKPKTTAEIAAALANPGV